MSTDNAFTAFFSRNTIDNEQAKPRTASADLIYTAHKSQGSTWQESIDSDTTASEERKTIQRILETKAKANPYNKNKQRFSRRLSLSGDNGFIAAVCEKTGATIGITFPNIPGRVFTYDSPLSRISNCRGIAQEGHKYLKQLDMQTLAAVLITLADSYSLFRYQTADSGAQKNAVLRTVAKDYLIDAILLIENHINSSNAPLIPKLSLILDTDVNQNGIQLRMLEWLKLLATYVSKLHERVDAETEDAFYSSKPRKPKLSGTVAQANKDKLLLNKEFREFKKEAKEDIIILYKDKVISLKLKSYLISVLTSDNILTANRDMVELLATKLDQLGDNVCSEIADNIRYFRNKLEDIQPGEFDAPVENTFASEFLKSEDQSSEDEDNEFGITSDSLKFLEAVPEKVAKPTSKSKSIFEILAEKKALKEANISADSNKEEDNDGTNDF